MRAKVKVSAAAEVALLSTQRAQPLLTRHDSVALTRHDGVALSLSRSLALSQTTRTAWMHRVLPHSGWLRRRGASACLCRATPQVDLLTIVPVAFDLMGVGGANLGFLRVVRVMRVLRILRMRRLVSLGENEVERQVFVVFFTIVCISFCTAGLLQVRTPCSVLSTHPPRLPITLTLHHSPGVLAGKHDFGSNRRPRISHATAV